jgi:hypothetical protein
MSCPNVAVPRVKDCFMACQTLSRYYPPSMFLEAGGQLPLHLPWPALNRKASIQAPIQGQYPELPVPVLFLII